MFESLLYLLEALFPIVTILVAAGAAAKWLGRADSVMDGTKKILNGLINFMRPDNPPTNQFFQIPEQEFQDLTKMLQPFFEYIIFDTAFQNDDFIQVTYQCGKFKGSDPHIITVVWQKFIRDYFNLPANTPLATYIYCIGGRLTLIWGRTETGQKWIQQQAANYRSRQIPNDCDLVE